MDFDILGSRIYWFRSVVSRAYLVLRLTPFDVSTTEGRSKERYRKIVLNAFTNILARGAGIVVGVVTIPLVLHSVGKDVYAFWFAITSFVTWVSLFDFGLINGLVNAISEAYGKDDKKASRGYVSTSFFLLTGLVVVGIVILIAVMPFVAWDTVFGVNGLIDSQMVRWCVWAAILPVLLSMPLSVVRQVYTGYQRTYFSNFFLLAGSLFTLGGMFVAIKLNVSLPWLILIYGGGNLIFVFINFMYLVLHEMPWLMPSLAYFSPGAIKRLLNTSVPLFLYQIGALLVNNSQPLIMMHRSTTATVADYSVIMRLYVVLSGLMVWSTNSFVPSFREAHERGDYAWLRLSFKRMLFLRLALAGMASVLFLGLGNWLLGLWLGHTDPVTFRIDIWLALGISMLATAWVTAFSDFLTIMDKIWVQVVIVLINGLATILLTYWLTPQLGVLGAIVAVSCINVVLSSWLMPLIARPILQMDRHLNLMKG
jgi:O-antigen/teichoic acid export membrane protein